MKRDWDLVRRILITVEDAPPDTPLMARHFADVDNPTLFGHVRLLTEAGYLKAQLIPSKTGSGGGEFRIADLVWDGHDLLAKMRSETWWAKIKATAKDKGLDLTWDVIKALAAPAASAVLGIPSS